MAQTRSCSREANIWGLKSVTRRVSEPQSIQLLVKFFRRKKVGNRYQLDDPFPRERQPDPAVNIIQQALYVKAHLKINPNEYAIVTAEKLGIHRKRIPKLMSILENLPAEFQQRLHNCQENRIHRIFSLRTLHNIAQLNSKEQMVNRLESLLPNSLNFPN